MMPSKHKTPLLGWHPPAELSAWARDEAARLGVPLARILNAAVEAYREAPGAGLVEDALFLRMYGERPPGAPPDPHKETWQDWDRRAEAWLRARHEGAS
jgi:hypothetical protein